LVWGQRPVDRRQRRGRRRTRSGGKDSATPRSPPAARYEPADVLSTVASVPSSQERSRRERAGSSTPWPVGAHSASASAPAWGTAEARSSGAITDRRNGHRLAVNEVLVVQRGTRSMPLRQELVLARLRPQELAETHLRSSRSRSSRGRPASAGSARYRERSDPCYRSPAFQQHLALARVRIPYAP